MAYKNDSRALKRSRGGPRSASFEELLRYLLATLHRRRLLLPVPARLAAFQARFLEYLPSPPLTRDQIRLLQKDNVVAPGALTLADLGIEPPDHRDGCLQDVHWCYGIGGGFQGYTIGNILSAQLYSAAVAAHAQIPEEIGRGRFDTLHSWLKTNVYQPGRKYGVHTRGARATGGPGP